MAKLKTSYFCQNCGSQHAKWSGQCTSCNAWNTLVEEIIQQQEKRSWKQNKTQKTANKPLSISDIEINKELRIHTQNNELDTVLGGGIVPGSIIL